MNLKLSIVEQTHAPHRKPIALVFTGKDTYPMKEKIALLRFAYLDVPHEWNNGKPAWIKYVNPSEVKTITEEVKSWGASIINTITRELAAALKTKEAEYNKVIQEREASLLEWVRGKGWNGKFYGYVTPYIFLNGDRHDLSEHEHKQLLHAVNPNAPAPEPAPAPIPDVGDAVPYPTPSGIVWPTIAPGGIPIELEDDDLPF